MLDAESNSLVRSKQSLPNLQNLERTYQRTMELRKSFRRNRHRILSTIFREWATYDVESMVAHAKTKEGPNKSIAFDALVQVRDDLSNAKLLFIAREFGIESRALVVLEESAVASAKIDPEKSWEYLENDSRPNELWKVNIVIP